MLEFKSMLQRAVTVNISKATGSLYAPVAVSNRHVHLDAANFEKLFGKNYTLQKLKMLVQPGQFACVETVTLCGGKSSIDKVRIVGPLRRYSQVEISITDAIKLGINTKVKLSGDLDQTPGIKITGPAGEVVIDQGVIIAARHLHISPEDAKTFDIKDGDIVRAKKKGVRGIVFENIIVRSAEEHVLELHIDTDEANAAGISQNDILLIEKNSGKENS